MESYLVKKDYKKFVDISLAFEPNALTGDLNILTNERAISNSIQNLILTIPGEVPFQSDIGSQVTNYLFELLDEGTAGILQQEIERVIRYSEPRVEIVSVVVEAQQDQHAFFVTVKYKIIGYQEIITVTQILEPTR